MGPEYLRASNGDGPAVRATISSDRLPTDMDIITDSVANWPAKGIATSGTPDDEGIIIPGTECVFYYVLSGTIIHITGFAPGYYDTGNTENQIVIIKPTTAWADELAEATEGGSSVTISETPPPDAEEGDMWGDTSSSAVSDLAKLVGNFLMPVGFTYINFTDSTNPGTKLGFGTWVRQEDRFILAAGTNYPIATTGGAATHTLTKAELPSIGGTFRLVGWSSSIANGDFALSATNFNLQSPGSGSTWGSTTVNMSAGSNQPHNNMPPYKTAYVWERTA